MAPASPQRTTDESSALSRPNSYTGEVVYIYAFDVAYEMTRRPVKELLGQPVAQFEVDTSHRSPRQLFFYKAQTVRLPPVERIGPRGPVRVERAIKLLPVGAISVTIRVPFSATTLEELVDYHDLEFSHGPLHQEARQLAEDARSELASYYVRPVPRLEQEEAYTVFCVAAPLPAMAGEPISSEAWLRLNRREIAALLTQEPEINRLSQQESDESTDRYLSYYQNDLAVIDWDAALIVEERKNIDETLYVMELANLQLAELEAYDRILDDALERAYRDLGERPPRRRGHILRELREFRIDLARLSDELQNITKFFGDWHLARIYECIATRFHLADWHRTIDEKLKTLDNLYQLLQGDQNNRVMLGLEVTIVILFVVDLVILAGCHG